MALCVVILLTGCSVSANSDRQRIILDLLTDEKNFPPLPPPQPGDWRSVFREKRQSFKAYTASRPIRSDSSRRKLFIQPIGPFTEEGKWLLERTKEYASHFFSCEVVLAQAVPLPGEGFRTRAAAGKSWRQWRTGVFLDRLLPSWMTPDAFLCIGVTMADLYPSESWNFVFGQARLRDRVGVYSFARYFPSFWGGEDPPARSPLVLKRVLKLLSHETCHMLGLHHCVDHPCCMNGSNSLGESDRRPLHLCGLCLRKLAWNRGFDPVKRYKALRSFLQKHGMKDEAAWIEGRLKKVRHLTH